MSGEPLHEASTTEADPELRGQALGAEFLARAKAQFALEAAIPVDIPELAKAGKPFRVYVTPLSAYQRDEAMKRSTDRKGHVNQAQFAARVAIMKARDHEGAAIFKPGNLAEIEREVDMQILGRIANAVLGETEDAPDADDVLEPS